MAKTRILLADRGWASPSVPAGASAGLRDAFKAAERPATARRQAGKRENPTQCWLEQQVRERESLYVTITKPLV